VDIQQYIASGIIEAYVLGIASREEMHELESLSLQYPEIDEAVEEYRAALETFSTLHKMDPPPGLKEQIWSALKDEDNDQAAIDTGNHVVPFTVSAEKRNKNTVPMAAAIVLLAGSLLLNFVFWNKAKSTEAAMASMKTEQEKMLADNQSFRQQLEQARQQFRVLFDPAVKSIALAGVGNHTGNSAMLLWDSRTKEVYLSLKNMPPPPKGKQYQLWAIVNGKPVDAGMYALQQQDDLQKMKVIPTAEMFAITLEQEGGSPTPTMEEMYVAGKV
jgi:anti-sigma-K factor RskA